MTPPPPTHAAAELSAEALADRIYQPRVAAPGWEPSRRFVAMGWTLCAYSALGLVLLGVLFTRNPPRVVPPKVLGTVTLIETLGPVSTPSPAPATRSIPEPPPIAAPALPAPAPLPALAGPAIGSSPTRAISAPATSPSAASSNQGQPTVSATAPRFDAAYLNNPDPTYPAASRRIGEEGRVILRVLVSPLGQAEQVEVRTSSGSSRLDQAALAAVKRWRFEPARQGATAIAAWVLVPISFHLDA